MKKGSTKTLIRNFILFIALIVLTLWVILKDQSITAITDVLKNVKITYVYIGIGCMTIYLFLEGINMRRTLRALNEKVSIMQAFKYSLIGFFFSSITPAASGGQPMQIYYMHKDKIAVSNSTLALLINLTSMQISTISIAIISLIYNYSYVNDIIRACVIIGILLNSSALVLLVIGVFTKRLSRGLIKLAFRLLKVFKVKNITQKKYKLVRELKKYQDSAKYIKENKPLMLKTLATTIVQFTIYYSIAYWTYKALGFSGRGIVEITTMQAVLFASVSGIPSPGAVGVSEGIFIEIFRNIYSTNIIKSATLLNRGVNFYLFVLISGIVVIINQMRIKDDLKE